MAIRVLTAAEQVNLMIPIAGVCASETELATYAGTDLDGKLVYCEAAPLKILRRVVFGYVDNFSSSAVITNQYGLYFLPGGFLVWQDSQGRENPMYVTGTSTIMVFLRCENMKFDAAGNPVLKGQTSDGTTVSGTALEDGYYWESRHDFTARTRVYKEVIVTKNGTGTPTQTIVLQYSDAMSTGIRTYTVGGPGSGGGSGLFFRHKGASSSAETGTFTVPSGSFSYSSGLITATGANAQMRVSGTIPIDRYCEASVNNLATATGALIILKDGANAVYVQLLRDATSKIQVFNSAVGGSAVVESTVTYAANGRVRVWVTDYVIYASYGGVEIAYPIPSAQQSLTDVVYFQLSTSGGAFNYVSANSL